MKTLLFAVAFSFPTVLLASDDIPTFSSLMEEGQTNSSLAVSCNHIDKKTIECDFSQKRINNIKPDPLPRDEDIKKGVPEIEKICKSNDLPKPVNEYDHREMNLFKENCSCMEKKGADKAVCLKGYIAERISILADTCKISSNDFKHVLKKVSEGKWMKVTEPSGACSIVNSIVIEKIGNHDWKYTQIRLSIDKKVELCKSFDENIPLIYRSNLPKIDTLSCKYIDMSRPF